jgi:excisionase family DNA binding protein
MNHKDSTQAYQIYALVDPRDGLVRYIGMSKDAHKRFLGHLMGNYGNMHEGRWINLLRKFGMEPILEVLEIIEEDSDAYALACEREIYWIREMTRLGHSLFNVSGNKSPYQSPSKSEKMYTPETDTKKLTQEDQRKLTAVQVVQASKGGKRLRKDEQVDTQSTSMSEEQTLTIRDVVIEMGVNEKTVRRWIQNKELHATKDIFGRYRITRADLDNFVRRREERYNPDNGDGDA